MLHPTIKWSKFLYLKKERKNVEFNDSENSIKGIDNRLCPIKSKNVNIVNLRLKLTFPFRIVFLILGNVRIEMNVK